MELLKDRAILPRYWVVYFYFSIIPFKSNSNVQIIWFINYDSIFVFQYYNNVVKVIFRLVFYLKIIYNNDKSDSTGIISL